MKLADSMMKLGDVLVRLETFESLERRIPKT